MNLQNSCSWKIIYLVSLIPVFGNVFENINMKLKEFPTGIPTDTISINVSGNRLQEFRDDALLGLPLLHTINAAKNKLTSIPNLNYVAKSLETLILNKNKIEKVSKEDFTGLLKLETLDLSFNSLNTFPDFTFIRATLKVLYLEKNVISYISPDALKVLKAIDELWLPNNNISNFLDLGQMPTLRYIRIYGNEFSGVMDRELLFGCEKLEYFSIDNMQITHFPDFIYVAKTLRLIKIDENIITYIPKYLLERFHVLRFLDVARNLLKIFEPTLNLGTLDVLRVEGNQLTKIPQISLMSQNLHKFRIYGNSITKILPEDLLFLNRNISAPFRLEAKNLSITTIPPVIGPNRNNITILAEHVPFICDVRMAWIFMLPQSSLDNIVGKCDQPIELKGLSLKDVTINALKVLDSQKSKRKIIIKRSTIVANTYSDILPMKVVHTKSTMDCISLCSVEAGCVYVNINRASKKNNMALINCHLAAPYSGKLMEKPDNLSEWTYYSVVDISQNNRG